MLSQKRDDIEIQRIYYAKTAARYDEMHICEKDEHFFALSFLVSVIDFFDIKSVLDIGSGTGRSIKFVKRQRSDIHIIGVEPVKELRRVAYRKGLSKDELIEGDATNLKFDDEQFDLVCEFGALHHIKHPETAVLEMLRVSKKAIFISDCNNFGRGSPLLRSIKQLLNSLGLWRVADYIKTKGKGYTISDGDGLAYSYSVFNNYRLIRKSCKHVHILNTSDSGVNPYRNASHVVLLGIKK